MAVLFRIDITMAAFQITLGQDVEKNIGCVGGESDGFGTASRRLGIRPIHWAYFF